MGERHDGADAEQHHCENSDTADGKPASPDARSLQVPPLYDSDQHFRADVRRYGKASEDQGSRLWHDCSAV
jgi:hypothetical protein